MIGFLAIGTVDPEDPLRVKLPNDFVSSNQVLLAALRLLECVDALSPAFLLRSPRLVRHQNLLRSFICVIKTHTLGFRRHFCLHLLRKKFDCICLPLQKFFAVAVLLAVQIEELAFIRKRKVVLHVGGVRTSCRTEAAHGPVLCLRQLGQLRQGLRQACAYVSALVRVLY